MFVFLIIVIIIFIWGHYGFSEKINPADYQNPPSKRDLMKGADPFVLEGDSDTAFLVVHGFEGSPYTLRPLAEVLNKRGHTVFAPLLPGHGTSINRFKKTRYEHWYYMVERMYLKERPKYKNFFLLGFSLGGNLSLKCATSFARTMPPTGLIVISAPVFLNGFFNGKLILQDIRLFFTGIAKEFIDFIPKRQRNMATTIMNPWVGYSEVYAVACTHSLKRHISKVRKKLSEIKIPTCLIQASNDRTVSSENLNYIFNKIRSKEKRCFMFTIGENVSTRHILITHEQTRNKVYHYVLEFVDDCLMKFDLTPEASHKEPLSSGKELLKSLLVRQ